MRKLAVTVAALVLLVSGVSLAVACTGGASGHDGNAGYDQYNPKPGCGPWKTDGYAGGSGYHSGQPPKDDNRGDCPKPPCDDHYGHFSGYGSSQHGNDDCNDCGDDHYSGYGSGGGGSNDNNCCDDHKYSSSGGGGGGKGDCRSSSADISPVELSRT